MSSANEADPEGGGDEAHRSSLPVMTKTVGSHVTAVAGKARPLAWTSMQLAESTVRPCVRKKSITKMAMDMLANKNFQAKV
jgi:hypothetical protein